jgi:hypothetical protein
VKADAGKSGGTIERLLIEHARLDKMRGKLASEVGWRYNLRRT